MDLALNILVIVATVALTALGLMSMFAPRRMVANFAIEPVGTPGLSTIRSVIGGLFLASVALLVIGLTTGQTLGYVAVSIVMAAVTAGRIIGILADGFDKAVVPPLVVELAIIAILMTAYTSTGM
ncbi:DUF4345 family protein [Shimia sp. R9_3]|uniref:DUF4345 family protein n=1 Tax=Shimia sp. R9_3 TaxID=2821113 RepID=UPI001ADAC5B0|nr:DUF4345 family protein [Shimia sp. R9_3]MBO9400718.1 DUF4345 family protein [Shimia sp. R9_3]